MRNKLVSTFAVVVGLLIASVPLAAHHGSASFETGKPITVKGTVTEWFWANPHCLLKFDEKTEDGQIRHWVTETQAPANMIDAGWSRVSFKPGDQVSVEVRAAKNGKFVGAIYRVTLADGTVYDTENQTGKEPRKVPNQ